jgi:hypothetical protein
VDRLGSLKREYGKVASRDVRRCVEARDRFVSPECFTKQECQSLFSSGPQRGVYFPCMRQLHSLFRD